MTTETYYITTNWHDYPEGGSCGELIQAASYEEAEQKMFVQMAYFELENCEVDTIEEAGGEKKMIDKLIEDHKYDWIIVDCYPFVMNTISNLCWLTDEECAQLRDALNERLEATPKQTTPKPFDQERIEYLKEQGDSI